MLVLRDEARVFLRSGELQRASAGVARATVKSASLKEGIPPPGTGRQGPRKWATVELPALVVTGTEDFKWLPAVRRDSKLTLRPYTGMTQNDRYLVEILGAEHHAFTDSVPYYPAGKRDPRHHDWIARATPAFLDAHLKGDQRAREWLRTKQLERATDGKCRQQCVIQTPRAQNALSRKNCERAADYSAASGGRAVLVMQGGTIVFERYDNGHDANTPCHLHSATKGFWCAAAAAMVEDGLISEFDELASDTLPEWKEHRQKRRITVRHLLNLTSCLAEDLAAIQGLGGTAPDMYRHAIGLRCPAPPGQFFRYGPSHYYAFGELAKRKLAAKNQTPLDYLKERILDPIGCQVADWQHDASGNPHIPNGAYLTAREWIKYGRLLLQRGSWNGKQLIPADLLAECLQARPPNPGHGVAIWLNRPGGHGVRPTQASSDDAPGGFIYPDGHPDLFAALGAGKCRTYMMPELDAVVVRLCETRRDAYRDRTFLRILLQGSDPDTAASESGPTRKRARGDRTGLARRMIRRNDRNGDGKLGAEEAPQRIRRAFRWIDRNADGGLDETELEALLHRVQRSRR